MKKTDSGVYMIRNTVSGNTYIGSAKNISKRFAGHRFTLKKGIRNNLGMLNDYSIYGASSFEYIIVEFCDIPCLKERESYYFDLYKPTYNVWKTIYSAKGRAYTPEQKERIVASAIINLKSINTEKELQSIKLKNAWIKRRNDPNFQETIAKCSRLGMIHSEETKSEMSKNRLGKKKPDSMKEKTRQRRLGTKWDKENKKWIKPSKLEVSNVV